MRSSCQAASRRARGGLYGQWYSRSARDAHRLCQIVGAGQARVDRGTGSVSTVYLTAPRKAADLGPREMRQCSAALRRVTLWRPCVTVLLGTYVGIAESGGRMCFAQHHFGRVEEVEPALLWIAQTGDSPHSTQAGRMVLSASCIGACRAPAAHLAASVNAAATSASSSSDKLDASAESDRSAAAAAAAFSAERRGRVNRNTFEPSVNAMLGCSARGAVGGPASV
jgi:hypothetical protein